MERRAVLTSEEAAHFLQINIETIRLMAEINQVTKAHGGWPGAFHANLQP
jgi:hypothetical protein